MENPTNPTQIRELMEDKGNTLDYNNPKFTWDLVDEGSQTINEDNPFSGL